MTATVMVLAFELKNHYISLAGTFAVYSALLFAGATFVHAKLPETKGKRFEEVQALLAPDGHRD